MDIDKAYTVLGVVPGVDPKEVQRAYRRRALEFHPDRVDAKDAEFYSRKFMEIRDAYELLRKSGFPVPEPETVVEEPEYFRAAGRSFKLRPKDEAFQKVRFSTGNEMSPATMLFWGVFIPLCAVAIVLFLRFLLKQEIPAP